MCDDLHRHPQGHPNRHPQGHPRHLRTPAIEDLVSLSLSISPDGSPSLSPRTARLQVPFTRATINNHYDPLNLVFRLILPEVLTFLAVLFVRLWPAAYVAHLQGTDVRRIIFILVITLNQSTSSVVIQDLLPAMIACMPPICTLYSVQHAESYAP